MTTRATISHSSLTPSREPALLRLCHFVRGAVVCLGLAAMSLTAAQAQQTPQPVIVADFNYDGIPDALVVSTTSPTVSIAFGSVPYGTFSAGAKAVTFPSGCVSLRQGSVLTGDFNNDGFADIAFFCSDASGVLLGNGDGTFAAPKLLTGVAGATVVLGDFNKDGKLDLAAIGLTLLPNGTQAAVVQFFAGKGDGTFATPVTSTLDRLTYSGPAVADLNADGYADLVLLDVSPNSTPSVNLFGNNKDGTFGTLNQGLRSANTSATVSLSASSVLFGHFFGTTAIDVVVPSTGANGVISAFKNTSTAAGYSFNDPVTVAFPGLTGAQAGSFTGSGFTDIAASNGASIAVLANDGAGNFAAAYSGLTVASASSLFVVADANGDGYADIYTATLPATGPVQLAANVTSGSATATSQPFPLGAGTKTVSATWNGNVNLLATTVTGNQTVTGAMTATALVSSKNPSTLGDVVTFTATVAPAVAGAVPTGSVVFADGTATLRTIVLDGTGKAAFATGILSQATHPITAAYTGDSYYAASTSPVLSQVVNHVPAAAPIITWASPAPVVYGAALSGTQLNASAADSTGASIPGSFTYTPAAGMVLDAGAKTLSVAFTPADPLSFLPATQTVTLTVTQASPLLTWVTPASIAHGVPLSATQLDAAAAGVTGATLPGTFTYTPAAGTVLTPGAQTLSVAFVPTNAVDYTRSSASVTLLVTGVSVSSFTPNTVKAGDPATKITLTGAGFTPTSVVQVNATAIPTTPVSPTTLTAVVPASYFANPGTLSITVADPSASLVSPALSLTVTPPNVGATVTAPPTTPPGSQTNVTVALTQPYPFDLTGTLTLDFTRSATPQLTDPALQFATGGTSLSFPIPANTTAIPSVQLQAGTIAGTITVPLKLIAGTVDITPAGLTPASIVVPPAVPSLSGMTVTRSGSQLTVVIHGFSNTREVTSASFHFTAIPGATLGTTDLTLPAATIFNTQWFDTDASNAYGSTFTYTQIFNISDSAANIASVDVTLTNSVGASLSMTAK